MPDFLDVLAARGQSLATCESLTAGLLASKIAETPGASAAFVGGFVTYSSELKKKLAGVDTALIDAHGVVSPECAAAMAEGTRDRLGADYAIALTGVAGPTLQDGLPVGTVFVAVAGPDGVQGEKVLPAGQTRWALREGAAEPEEVVDGDRNEIRERSAQFAIELLERIVGGN